MADNAKLESNGESSPQSPSIRSQRRVVKHFAEEVSTSSGYYPLLICCFVTGLTDGTLYNG